MSWSMISEVLISAVRMATPLLFVALAELYSERAGLVNIGLDGIMAFGSLVGFLVCYWTGNPFLGVLCGALGGVRSTWYTRFVRLHSQASRSSTAWR